MVYAQIAADGQVEGEIAVGLGYALSGEILWEKEKVFSLDYRVPTGADMPAIKTIMVETDEPNTPFGNKVHRDRPALSCLPPCWPMLFTTPSGSG